MIKPAIAIAKLNNPVQWEGEVMVDLVVMLALKENNRQEIKKLFSMIREEDLTEKLKIAQSVKDIKKMFS